MTHIYVVIIIYLSSNFIFGSEFACKFSVIYSTKDYLLISGSDDASIKVWDALTGKCLKTLVVPRTTYKYVIYSVCATENGDYVISGGSDKTVRIWNVHTGELLHTLTGHKMAVMVVCVSSSGRVFSAGNHEIFMWNIKLV